MTRPAKGFTGYAPDLEPEVHAFQREAYPARAPDTILPNWRWMFVEPASRLGIPPWVWMYRRDNRIVAHQGAIPVRLKLGAREVVTGWFVETMATLAVRGSPVGPMVIRRALEDLPCNLSLGQTDQMRDLQFAMGWREVRSLPVFLMVVRPGFDLRKVLPPAVAGMGAMVLSLVHRAAIAWQRLRARGPWKVARVQAFGGEHDELWERMAAEIPCAVIRDAAYLSWKYLRRPVGSFTCLELRHGAQLAGIAVLTIREPNATYRYRRGLITDIVVQPSDEAAVRRLLVECVGELIRGGAVSVACFVAQPALERSLRRFGFISREPQHHFLVATGGLVDEEARLMLDPGAWFLTMGDSDLDAYAG